MIGRYVILDLLGSGAMGSVYAAYDPELDRRVAIKLLHEHGPHHEVQARMLREAQAMARLHHPNVVTIFDVGSLDHRIWLAMEFVDGQTLGGWLRDRDDRPWREILAILVAAAKGLAAAHAAGLIHRDVKPDNIMLGRDGRVQVADFGLARADAEDTASADLWTTGTSLLESDLTGAGALVGTPLYLAPEGFLGLPVDARSDQYSWAVTAWESLYGEPPYRAPTLTELRVAVLGGERRPPPAGAKVPTWLRRIIERALEIVPERRYPSIADLLTAIESHERRRRWRLATYGLALVGVIGAAFVGARHLASEAADRECIALGESIESSWSEARAAELREDFIASGHPEAATMFKLSRRWLDDYAERWRSERIALCRASLAGETEEQLRSRTCLDDRRQSFDALVGGVFANADRDVVTRSVSAAAGLPAIDTCSDSAWLARAPELPAESDTRAAITALQLRLARVGALQGAGKFKLANEEILPLLDEAEALGWPPLLLKAKLEHASLLMKTGSIPEAERLFEETLWRAESLGYDDLVAGAAAMLVYIVGHLQARPDDGLRWGRLGQAALDRSGDLESMRHATLMSSLGIVHEGKGDLEGAQALKEQTLALRQRLLGPEHPAVANAHNNLAVLHLVRGDLDSAERHNRRALAIRKRTLGPNHPDVGNSLLNLGNVLSRRRDYGGALLVSREAQVIFAETYGEQSPHFASIVDNIAGVLANLGDLDQALTLHRQALTIREETLPPHHPEIAISLLGLGDVLVRQGDAVAGIAHMRRGLTIFETSLGPEHKVTIEAVTSLGAGLLDLDRDEEGTQLLERASTYCEAPNVERSAKTCASGTWLLAQIRAEDGDLERARDLATRALADFEEAELSTQAREVETWLQEPRPAGKP